MAMYNAIQRAEVEDCGKAQGSNTTISREWLNQWNPDLRGQGKFYKSK